MLVNNHQSLLFNSYKNVQSMSKKSLVRCKYAK